jgi:hypothetical protein
MNESMSANPLNGRIRKKAKTKESPVSTNSPLRTSLYIVILFKKLSIYLMCVVYH